MKDKVYVPPVLRTSPPWALAPHHIDSKEGRLGHTLTSNMRRIRHWWDLCRVTSGFHIEHLYITMVSWFQAFATLWMRSLLFGDVTQHWLVISYQHFWATCQTASPLTMVLIGCPATSVTNNQHCITSKKRKDLKLGFFIFVSGFMALCLHVFSHVISPQCEPA